MFSSYINNKIVVHITTYTIQFSRFIFTVKDAVHQIVILRNKLHISIYDNILYKMQTSLRNLNNLPFT